MKHAGQNALDQLETLLEEIRKRDGIKERKRGIFYHRSSAFLHFHEDPAGLFADIRYSGGDFDRYPVNNAVERRELISRLDAALMD